MSSACCRCGWRSTSCTWAARPWRTTSPTRSSASRNGSRALDLVYVGRASLAYDLALIGRTVALIVAVVCGRRRFGDPPEMAEARRLLGATGDPVPSRNTATA